MQRLSEEEVNTLEVFASRIVNPSYLGAVKQPTLSALPFRRPQEVKDAANFFRNPAQGEIARLQKLFATGPSLVYKRHWFPENHKDCGNPELADLLVLGASQYPAWTTNADLERLERAHENGTGATGVIRTHIFIPTVFVGWSKPQLRHLERTAPGGLSANDGIFTDLRVAVVAIPSLAGRVNFRVTSLTLASLRAKETGSNTNPAPVPGRARLFTAASAPTTFDQTVPCRRFSNMDLQQLRCRVSEDSSLYAKDRFTEDWMVTPGNWNE
ncbi:hypothetical protein KJ359_008353 [Pestalotiopsis sp. 9143b]|nr:hypothetical protein KJ359_008353 [Pestalotiopsis sp. 9143b]